LILFRTIGHASVLEPNLSIPTLKLARRCADAVIILRGRNAAFLHFCQVGSDTICQHDATGESQHVGGCTDARATSYFYVGMAAACVLIAFESFAGTYWLQLPAGTFVGSPIIHLHAVLFSGWTILLLSQTILHQQRIFVRQTQFMMFVGHDFLSQHGSGIPTIKVDPSRVQGSVRADDPTVKVPDQ
jgi:hypothetical protein